MFNRLLDVLAPTRFALTGVCWRFLDGMIGVIKANERDAVPRTASARYLDRVEKEERGEAPAPCYCGF